MRNSTGVMANHEMSHPPHHQDNNKDDHNHTNSNDDTSRSPSSMPCSGPTTDPAVIPPVVSSSSFRRRLESSGLELAPPPTRNNQQNNNHNTHADDGPQAPAACTPQRQPSYPPLKFGHRYGHAAVYLEPHQHHQGAAIVVVGGHTQDREDDWTSVLVFRWHNH